jgi:hypothetical protein
MKPMDYAKALGLALLVLALNIALTFPAVFLYSLFVEPGHPPEFYTAAAPRIAMWTAPAGGVLLMALATYVSGRRRPERNAVAYALAVGIGYVLLDTASGLAMAPASEFVKPHFLMSMALAALAALAGGWLAQRRNKT